MNILYTVIADILHIIAILLVCKYYLQLETKNEDRYRYVKVLLLSIPMSLVINAVGQTTALIIYLVCVELITMICYSENFKKNVLSVLWTVIILEIVDMISISMMNTVGTIIHYHNEQSEKMLAMVLSLMVIYIVSVLLRRINREGIKNVSVPYLIVFTIILIADFILLMLMVNVTLEEMAYKNKIIYMIAYIFVVTGIFIQLAAVILLLVSRNEHKENERIIKQYLEEQVKHYEYLNEREKETKKFRHDIRGHLYFLNKLKIEGKDKEFEEYFEDIIDKVDDLGDCVNVGNDIVNAILSKTYTEAKNKNIKMSITGHFPTECNISVYNLCTIFFNLLNNAVEAADKTTKKEIWVVCQYTQKQIIIEIGNYYCKEKELDKNKLRTTKKEKEYHGWGIKNVEDSVTDCKGLMDIEVDEDKFIVSLTLNNEKGDRIE